MLFGVSSLERTVAHSAEITRRVRCGRAGQHHPARELPWATSIVASLAEVPNMGRPADQISSW